MTKKGWGRAPKKGKKNRGREATREQEKKKKDQKRRKENKGGQVRVGLAFNGTERTTGKRKRRGKKQMEALS